MCPAHRRQQAQSQGSDEHGCASWRSERFRKAVGAHALPRHRAVPRVARVRPGPRRRGAHHHDHDRFPPGAWSKGGSPTSPTSPGYQAVTFLSGAGVVGGYSDGTFRPDLPLTRAQAAKMLVKLWEVAPQGSCPFRDVDPSYAPYVAAAAARGWISGYPDGSFRPNAVLSRQQMALILVRSLGWAQEAGSLSAVALAQKLQGFTDVGADPAAGQGIVRAPGRPRALPGEWWEALAHRGPDPGTVQPGVLPCRARAPWRWSTASARGCMRIGPASCSTSPTSPGASPQTRARSASSRWTWPGRRWRDRDRASPWGAARWWTSRPPNCRAARRSSGRA